MPMRVKKQNKLFYGGGMLALFGAILLSVCLLSGCGKEAASASDGGAGGLPTITVGCDDYAPFSYVDVDGNMTGIDVELAREAFSRMGYQAEFTIINWEEKKELLQKGEIDCIWSSFTMDGREEEYHWAGPYMESHQVVAVTPNSEITTLADLEGKTIAVQSTTKPEDIIRSHDGTLPQLRKVISVPKRDLIFVLLGKGYVDALAAHDTAVAEFMSEAGLEFRILEQPLQTVGLGIAFDKDDNRGLHTKLNSVLAEMRKDGTTAEIIGKYLTDADRYLGGINENEKEIAPMEANHPA